MKYMTKVIKPRPFSPFREETKESYPMNKI